MSQALAPKGFVPLRTMNGSPYDGKVVMAYIPASDGTATFVGDVVKHNGTSGAAGKVINGLNMEGVPQVIVVASGTAGQDIFGVVVGFLPDPTDLTKKHRAASTDRVALICPVTGGMVFEIQEDAVAANVAAADVGLNASFTLTAGSATTGVSAFALDSSAVATTATFPLKILGLSKRVNNAFGTASTDGAYLEVMFNTGLYQPNIAGV